ncbi:MAG TPA: hypothetical protein VHK06_07660 [Candidatus Limnocylindria bacterium]|nr:hypothetical protein [Candidatus Limnocylindria bacterium]
MRDTSTFTIRTLRSSRLIRLCLIALLLVPWNAGNPAPARAADPLTCAGYPQRRIFLESQSWWSASTSIPLGGRSEHVHTGVCFPFNQTLRGVVSLDVVTKMHMVPGWYLRFVRVQAASDQDGVRTLRTLDIKTQRCTTNDCTFINRISFDTSSLGAGRWEFRVHSEIREGQLVSDPASLATNGWHACVRLCSGGRTPQATDWPEGRGWYKNESGSVKGYVNARLDQYPPIAAVPARWCPDVRTLKGAGDEPVTRSFVSIDPDWHRGYAGRVIWNAPGTRDGPLCIDTTRLSDGQHKLFIRADWEAGPLAGAFVVPFRVDN